MNCDNVRPVLLDYVMEEVPAHDRLEIARHLETCSPCSEEAGKCRQTIGAMAQGAAFEEVPVRIRIVAEPANRWAAFWRNPARLALAASGLACVAIAGLALAHTTITYSEGNFEIAFGVAVGASTASNPLPSTALRAGTVATNTTANLAPNVTNAAPVAAVQGITRDETQRLITEAVAASEARQSSDIMRMVQAATQQTEAKRINERDRDQRELAESFRYFEAAQVNMWKQQVESQEVMSALVQRTGMDAAPRP